MTGSFDPLGLIVVVMLLTLIPTFVVVSTCFLKISMVISLIRNAIGVQQIPPNLAIYGLSLILTAYVMAPVGYQMYQTLLDKPFSAKDIRSLLETTQTTVEPMRKFLIKNSKIEQRDFFVDTAKQLWGNELAADVKHTDFMILLPAFLVSELTAAFQIGFLLYLPFVVIDIIISNILLAMGMMMVSPVTISLPLKLFLFVMVDGWSRMIHGLVLTYI